MRLQKYITEKFAGANMVGTDLYEIFRNPDNKEMKEIQDKSKSFKGYVVDVYKRDVYVGIDTTPVDMVASIHPRLDLDYDAYVKNGLDMDRYIMFYNDKSDEYDMVSKSNSGDDLSEILDTLEEMRDTNINWASKWVQHSVITHIIDGTISDMRKKLK